MCSCLMNEKGNLPKQIIADFGLQMEKLAKA